MRDFMTIVKALADENRVRTILALEGRELCVCQIIELLGLAPSTVSKHMAVLHQARLVESRKQGRWIYYRLAGDDAPAEAREAIDWACRSLSRAAPIREDAGRLKQLLKLDPHELCKSQKPTDRREAKRELRARVN